MNKKLADAINVQLNFEIESAYVYLAILGYIQTTGLEGFENWFNVQYQEELSHAKKFIDYLAERGERVEITGFETPRNDYDSILEALEVSLAHEKEVTRRINNLMTIAIEVKDYAAISFLNWYIDEQVEEEDNFSKLIDKVKLLDGKGLYMLDKDLAGRVFVDETQAE